MFGTQLPHGPAQSLHRSQGGSNLAVAHLGALGTRTGLSDHATANHPESGCYDCEGPDHGATPLLDEQHLPTVRHAASSKKAFTLE